MHFVGYTPRDPIKSFGCEESPWPSRRILSRKKEINGFLIQSLEELIPFSGDSKSCFILCSIFMKKITYNWLSGEHLG